MTKKSAVFSKSWYSSNWVVKKAYSNYRRIEFVEFGKIWWLHLTGRNPSTEDWNIAFLMKDSSMAAFLKFEHRMYHLHTFWLFLYQFPSNNFNILFFLYFVIYYDYILTPCHFYYLYHQIYPDFWPVLHLNFHQGSISAKNLRSVLSLIIASLFLP